MEANRPDEPGYAGINTFQKLPLVLDPAELEGVDVAILGAPMDDLVTHRPGTRFGPREIRSAIEGGGRPRAYHMDLGIDPFAELKVVDHGDAAVTPANPEGNHRAIRKSVSDIVSAGAVPVVLGGDHSISYPDIAAVAEQFDSGSLAVIHFDAHADTALENWGVEWSHGTPFRHLVDNDIIRGDRLVQIALRGYWPYPEEWAWMRSAGIRWHRMEQVVDAGIDTVVKSALYEIGDAAHLFLSVDIDSLDPAFAPGTGTPEPGGLSTRELLRAVRRIVLERGLVGMDVVEVSPPYDHAQITSIAAHRVVLEALSALAVHRKGGTPKPEDP
jgi:agmatinase